MSLDSFFKINMPYCINRRTDGAYVCMNREYSPLGYVFPHYSASFDDPFGIFFKKEITPQMAATISVSGSEDVNQIHLYRDHNKDYPENIEDYFKRLKMLFSLKIKTKSGKPLHTGKSANVV